MGHLFSAPLQRAQGRARWHAKSPLPGRCPFLPFVFCTMPVLDPTQPGVLAQAADALAAGQLLGLPTETVYGLAANAEDDAAVRRIFAVKGRPASHPLIVHVAGSAQAEHFAQQIPDVARRLMAAFWPGPLTLVLPRRADVAQAAAGGHASIGLRCPAHAVAQSLLVACEERGVRGLAAPSANLFGRVSPTQAAHVAAAFPDLLVLDGGACPVGIESAIVDCTRGQPVLLRPGTISRDDMQKALGCRVRHRDELPPASAAPQAPGTLAAHYAPRAKVRLMDGKMLKTALELLGSEAAFIAVWVRSPLKSASSRLVMRRMPASASQAARELFSTLRAFDDAQVKLIWVETPPDDMQWEGVRDRLERAAASD